MLPDNEPPHRWADDDWVPEEFNTRDSKDKSSFKHLSLAEALKRAEFAARVQDITPPALEAIVALQSDNARDVGNGAICANAPTARPNIRRKQATLFLAGIGAVALGKFAIVVAISPVFSGSPKAQHDHPPLAKGLSGIFASSATRSVTEAEATLQRFAFTSGKAFSDATAAFASRGEVSLAEP